MIAETSTMMIDGGGRTFVLLVYKSLFPVLFSLPLNLLAGSKLTLRPILLKMSEQPAQQPQQQEAAAATPRTNALENATVEVREVFTRFAAMPAIVDSLVDHQSAAMEQQVRGIEVLQQEMSQFYVTYIRENVKDIVDDFNKKSRQEQKQQIIFLTTFFATQIQIIYNKVHSKILHLKDVVESDWVEHEKTCRYLLTQLNKLRRCPTLEHPFFSSAAVAHHVEVLEDFCQRLLQSAVLAHERRVLLFDRMSTSFSLAEIVNEITHIQQRLNGSNSADRGRLDSGNTTSQQQGQSTQQGQPGQGEGVGSSGNNGGLINENDNIIYTNERGGSRKRKASEMEGEEEKFVDALSEPPCVSLKLHCDNSAVEDKETFIGLFHEFVSLDIGDRERFTEATIVFPKDASSTMTPDMIQNLLCVICQLNHLSVLKLNSAGASLPLSYVVDVLHRAKRATLKQIAVETTCQVDDESAAAKLGGALAKFPHYVDLSFQDIQGAFSIDTWVNAQSILLNPEENTFCTVVYRHSHDEGKQNSIYQKRIDRRQLVSLGQTIADLTSKTNLSEVRIDLPESLGDDGSSVVEFITRSRLFSNMPNLKSFRLVNVKDSEDGTIVPRLLEDLNQSTIKSFHLDMTCNQLQLIQKYGPAMLELIEKNVCLEHFSVRGQGFETDFDWEQQKAMYLNLNKYGRAQLFNDKEEEEDGAGLNVLIMVLNHAKDDLTCLNYFLSYKPAMWANSCF